LVAAAQRSAVMSKSSLASLTQFDLKVTLRRTLLLLLLLMMMMMM